MDKTKIQIAGAFLIKGITAEDQPRIFNWYRKGRGSFFLMDPHNKFLFISFNDIQKYYEQKFFIYEYIIFRKITPDTRPIGLLRMIPEPERRSVIFDLWLEEFSNRDHEEIIGFLKKYWLNNRLFHKLETRIVFEKEFLPVYRSAGFKTESLMRDEVFFEGRYFNIETLAFIAGHA